MRTSTKFIILMLGFNTGYFVWGTPQAQMPSLKMAPVLLNHTVSFPFHNTVAAWSHQLKDTPKPKGASGNCLPVAVELQKRIVRTGRMAIIVSVDPTPADNISHAVVVFDSDMNGSFDSFADNGFLTRWTVKPYGPLLRGEYGKYEGRCVEPEGFRCRLTGSIF